MVNLRKYLEALMFPPIHEYKVKSGFHSVRSFWNKNLKDLTPTEIAYAITSMFYMGADLRPDERKEMWHIFFEKKHIIDLLKEETRKR